MDYSAVLSVTGIISTNIPINWPKASGRPLSTAIDTENRQSIRPAHLHVRAGLTGTKKRRDEVKRSRTLGDRPDNY